MNQVFISYQHESPEHAGAVRRLGELLRQSKIPVALDQFYLDDHPGGPDFGGWPKWCEDCANQCACVLIIASEGWFAAYNKTSEPGSGLGAATEADIIRQALYDDMGKNARIRLAFLHDVAAEKVPVRLRAWHQFRPLDSEEQLDHLINWVADCLGLRGIEPHRIRWPEPVSFQPDLANRNTKEWPAIVDLLSGRSKERILLVQGDAGLGKSELLHEAAKYAIDKLNISVVSVNFKGGSRGILDVLGTFDLELGGDRLPNFSREGASKIHLLRRDLRAQRKPILIIFDHYEDILKNKPVADWLNQELLMEVQTSPGLAVIVAGQAIPDFTCAAWRQMARRVQLGPINDLKDWEPWIAQRYPWLRQKRFDLQVLLLAAQGKPALVVNLFEGLARSTGADA